MTGRDFSVDLGTVESAPGHELVTVIVSTRMDPGEGFLAEAAGILEQSRVVAERFRKDEDIQAELGVLGGHPFLVPHWGGEVTVTYVLVPVGTEKI